MISVRRVKLVWPRDVVGVVGVVVVEVVVVVVEDAVFVGMGNTWTGGTIGLRSSSSPSSSCIDGAASYVHTLESSKGNSSSLISSSMWEEVEEEEEEEEEAEGSNVAGMFLTRLDTRRGIGTAL